MKKLFTIALFYVPLFLFGQNNSLQKMEAKDSLRNDFLIYAPTTIDFFDVKIATVSKKEENLSDAPATAYVVTAEQIKNRGYVNLEEVLNDIPEIEIQRKSNTGSNNVISIRGIAGNEKFIILQDGIRINSIVGLPHAINYNFPVGHAKQIEIILGPASALYGVDAFTGIINIITHHPKEGNELNISTSAGQYQTTNNAINWGYAKKDISVNINANQYYSQDPDLAKYYPNEYAWYNNEYKNNGSMKGFGNTFKVPIKSFSTPHLANAINANLEYTNFQIGLNFNTETHSSSLGYKPENTLYWEDAKYKVALGTYFARYKIESKNKKLRVTSTISYSTSSISPESKYLNCYTDYKDGFKYDFSDGHKIEQQFNYDFNSKLNFTSGATFEKFNSIARTGDLPFQINPNYSLASQNIYYIGTNVKDKNNKDLSIPQDFHEINYHNYGAYLQLKYEYNHILKITAGTRFDYNSRYNPTVNPRIGLTIKPTDVFTLKLLYGHAYLAPSPHKAFSHWGNFTQVKDSLGNVTGFKSSFFHLTNSKLQPEKNQSIELNTDYVIRENFKISGDVYYNQLNDLIQNAIFFNETFKGVLVNAVERPVNKGKSNTYGGSVKLNWQLQVYLLKLNINTSYAYSNGDIDMKPLPYSAQHTLKSQIELVAKKYCISINQNFRSASKHKDYNVNRFESKAFNLFNLYAKYNFLMREKVNSSVFLKINNVLNTKYYNIIYDSISPGMPFTPQDPMRILAGINFEL